MVRLLFAHPEAEAGDDDYDHDGCAGGDADDARGRELVTVALLDLQELVHRQAIILGNIERALNSLGLQSLDLGDVQLSLLNLECKLHLLLLQGVYVLLVKDPTCRISFVRLYF